jgi:hypothetical protein
MNRTKAIKSISTSALARSVCISTKGLGSFIKFKKKQKYVDDKIKQLTYD